MHKFKKPNHYDFDWFEEFGEEFSFDYEGGLHTHTDGKVGYCLRRSMMYFDYYWNRPRVKTGFNAIKAPVPFAYTGGYKISLEGGVT